MSLFPKSSDPILCIVYMDVFIKPEKKELLRITLFSKWENVISLHQSVT